MKIQRLLGCYFVIAAAVLSASAQSERAPRRSGRRGRCSPMPDDREYMTAGEFAGLPSGAQITVWQAHAEGRVGAVPVQPSRTGGTLRYHRAQVLALLREAEAAR